MNYRVAFINKWHLEFQSHCNKICFKYIFYATENWRSFVLLYLFLICEYRMGKHGFLNTIFEEYNKRTLDVINFINYSFFFQTQIFISWQAIRTKLLDHQSTLTNSTQYSAGVPFKSPCNKSFTFDYIWNKSVNLLHCFVTLLAAFFRGIDEHL